MEENSFKTADGLRFRCKSCSGQLRYDIGSGRLVCESCGNGYAITSIPDPSLDDCDNCMDTVEYICPSCGASLHTSQTAATTFCSYCGSDVVLSERLSRIKRPAKIVPFRLTREDAEKKYRERLAESKCVPSDMLVQETLDQVKNGFGFFCDLWENHPLIAEVWPTTEADDPFYVEFSQSFKLDDNGFPIYDPEKLSDYTDREAKLLAIYAYNSIMVETLIYAIQQDGITFYLLDVRDEKWGTGILVLDDYKTLMSLAEEDSIPTGLAEDYSEFLNSIPEVREVVSQGKPMFARYDSPKDGEYYYLYISSQCLLNVFMEMR